MVFFINITFHFTKFLKFSFKTFLHIRVSTKYFLADILCMRGTLYWDLGSREHRGDDYSLSSDCLKSVLCYFKPITFDAMPSTTISVRTKFYSDLPSLNFFGVDLFSQSLDCSEFYYVFPPVSMALQVS